jgi:hypothetical protein
MVRSTGPGGAESHRDVARASSLRRATASQRGTLVHAAWTSRYLLPIVGDSPRSGPRRACSHMALIRSRIASGSRRGQWPGHKSQAGTGLLTGWQWGLVRV